MRALGRILNLFRRSQMEENLDLEVRSHLEMETEENVRRGMDQTEAERTARIRLGGVDQVKEMYREQWGIPTLESLFKDLVFAVRSLRRDPGFTVVAVLALTIGVAFTISIFTVVNGVLINPVDFPNPDRFVIFVANTQWGEFAVASYPNFEDWRNQQRSFAEMAAMRYGEFNLAGARTALRVKAYRVTPGFFGVLGTAPILGTAFPRGTPVTSRLAVLSSETWEKGFGRDPGVIGRTIRLDDLAYQICGVVPVGKSRFRESDVFILLDPAADPLARIRRAQVYSVIGRLGPGVTQKEAQTEIDLISRRLELAYPDLKKDAYVKLRPVQDHLVGYTRPRLLALMGAVLFVLLIACLNTASLLLTRGSLRAREVAVRSAIGATRYRVIRQFLIESLLLALIGSLLGLVGGGLAVRFLRTNFPYSVPRLPEATIDSHVVAFALLVGLGSALVFGLVPAIRSSRTNLSTALKEGASATTHSSGSLRMRSAMVLVQVALSAVLVIGAGLLIKSYWLLSGVKLGFRTDGLITAQTVLSSDRYKTAADQLRFVSESEERVRRLPGVESAGVANNLTFSNWAFSTGIEYETSDGERKQANVPPRMRTIRPGFLETYGISCLYGRTFDSRDSSNGTPVVLLDRTLAMKLFPGGQALNRRLFLEKQWRTVIGVVDSIRENGPFDEPNPSLYLPFDQFPSERVCWAIKTSVPPRVIIPEIRRVLEQIDRDQAIFSVQPMSQLFSEVLSSDRLNTSLMFAFAAAALALASLGLYGVLAYQVASRTREIGIRMAVGAHRFQVFRQVALGGLRLVVGGLGLGFLAAAGLTRVLSGMLYSVRPLDWSVFLIVAALLLGVGLAALAVPAWNASRLSPSRALRWE